jgi:hypothetical protein
MHIEKQRFLTPGPTPLYTKAPFVCAGIAITKKETVNA